MDQIKNIPASTAAAVTAAITVLSNVVLNSGQGSSRTKTTNSNNIRQYADMPLPAVKGVVQDESNHPTIHLSGQDYPHLMGDLELENVSAEDLYLPWSAGPIMPPLCDDDEDFLPKPKFLTPKRKVARGRSQGQGSSKRRRSQATNHTVVCKKSKTPCFGACDSDLKRLLEQPIPGPVQQETSVNDSEQSGSFSQVLASLHTDYYTKPISPLPLSGVISIPVQQAPAIEVEPAQPAIERPTEAEPVQQAVKLSTLDTCIREFDSLLERKRELGDAVLASTAKSLELLAQKTKLEAEKAEMERRLSELDKQLVAENSTKSSHQSEMDGITMEIDRWRSAWARRMK